MRGPEACEFFLHARPTAAAGAGAEAQAAAVHRALGDALAAEGGSFASVVSETVFLRSIHSDLEAVRAARRPWLAGSRAVTTEIEQPPLDERARLEVSLHAIVPNAGAPLASERFEAGHAHGVRMRLAGETHFRAAGLSGAGTRTGTGADAHAQALAMFAAAEDLLAQAGLTFHDVVRTWIHLREMDRDYAALNRARREFFTTRGIDPLPASTGIGGAPAADGRDLCLALHAVRPAERTVITAPTLNDATLYGSDFARGLRVVEANKVALHISGTASIDETGSTAHPDDFDAQVDRMLVNVAALLEGQGASFRDIVSAATYLKRPTDAARLRAKLHEAGFEGFPNALVVAPVCRPELLCEVEALAVLPKEDAKSVRGG